MTRSALVSDFDGTITQIDFYLLLVDRYMPREVPDFLAEWRQGKRTHFEAMQGYFDYTPADPAALDELLRDTLPDPALAESVASLNVAGWDLIVVSAGCAWYIERLLKGLPVTIHASPGEIDPVGGLRMRLPTESQYVSAELGIDKSAVVRDTLRRYERVAFAGDGPPDVAPSLLVDSDLRFARGVLAAELQRRGEKFHSFTRWSEIAASLTAKG